MKRFPDITVISWECDCGAHLTFSTTALRGNCFHTCYQCQQAYGLILDDILINVDVDPIPPLDIPLTSSCTDNLMS
jgi:hypothetical protein